MLTNIPSIADVLAFWFDSGWQDNNAIPAARLKFWFNGGPDIDRLIAERFADCLTRAADGGLKHWQKSPLGALALIIVLDQFSRNIHRGAPGAFANDPLALDACLNGMALGQDQALPLVGRAFFYLPMEHAEDLAIQYRSVTAFTALRDAAPEAQRKTFDGFLDYARRHQDIIVRFGRYPHRNSILGRESTAEEIEFLKQPGSSF